MNRKSGPAVVVGVLLVFLLGVGFVGYKLWKRKKNQEALKRWEVTVSLPHTPTEGVSLEEYLETQNAKLDRFEVLRPVLDDLNLVEIWGVSDPEKGLEMLRESSGFREGSEPGTMVFYVSDKDKAMAAELRMAISRSFDALQRREQLMPPAPPAGAEGN